MNYIKLSSTSRNLLTLKSSVLLWHAERAKAHILIMIIAEGPPANARSFGDLH
jgi:hypothetical protein